MMIAIGILLIAAALLGAFLLSRRDGGTSGGPGGALPRAIPIISPGLSREQQREMAQRDAATALAARGGWEAVAGGVNAVDRRPGVTFYQSAIGWTGGTPPEGHAVYPGGGSAIRVTVGTGEAGAGGAASGTIVQGG